MSFFKRFVLFSTLTRKIMHQFFGHAIAHWLFFMNLFLCTFKHLFFMIQFRMTNSFRQNIYKKTNGILRQWIKNKANLNSILNFKHEIFVIFFRQKNFLWKYFAWKKPNLRKHQKKPIYFYLRKPLMMENSFFIFHVQL